MFPKRRRLSKVEGSPSSERERGRDLASGPKAPGTAPRAQSKLLIRLTTASHTPPPCTAPPLDSIPVTGHLKTISSGYRVSITPGGSTRPLEDDRPLFRGTPGGSFRQLRADPPYSYWHPDEIKEDLPLPPESRTDSSLPGPHLYIEREIMSRQNVGTSCAPVRAASPVAGTSTELVVWEVPFTPIHGASSEPVRVESPVPEPSTSILASASAAAPVNQHSGSDLDIEYEEDETSDIFASAIGWRELMEDLNEDGEIVLAETDRVINEVHEGLPGVNIGFEWSEDFSTFRGTRETFTAGPSEHAASYDTPYDAFIAIWDESIMKHIATETNRYALQTIDGMVEREGLTSNARLNEWAETNENELYVLFGLYIMMGYNPRLRLVDYWATSRYLNVPGFSETMSYNRHLLLNKFLHFINNDDHVSHNDTKLAKLQPIIDHCYTKFERLYELGEHISINESLTLCKGRPSWAQCITPKMARFGIKSFELCDSGSGYLWRFMIYTAQSSHVPITELAGKSTEIVLKLLQGLEGKGYYITMDKYYNSPLFARYLKSRGFDCVGTLRPHRKNVPDEIKIKHSTTPGTIVARHSGDVSVLAWKDSQVVTTISTFHDAQTFLGRKAGKALTKPVVVRDYNKYMDGVHLKYQKLAMYLVERKRCVKWYMEIFKRLLNVSVHNAYVLHRRTLERRNQAILSHRDFREALAEALVNRHKTSAPKVNRSFFTGKRLQVDITHVPNKSSRRRCARCSALGIYKKVSTACTTCDVGLCLGLCWKEYHSEPDLRVRK